MVTKIQSHVNRPLVRTPDMSETTMARSSLLAALNLILVILISHFGRIFEGSDKCGTLQFYMGLGLGCGKSGSAPYKRKTTA